MNKSKNTAPAGLDGIAKGRNKTWLMVLLLILGGAGAATGPVLVDLITGQMTGAVDQALIIDGDEFTVDDVTGGYDARFVSTSDDGTQFQVAVEANNGDLFKIQLPIQNRGEQDMVAQIELPWNLQGQATGLQVDVQALYWYIDANHNSQLDEGEAIVLTADATLDANDEIKVPGAADFKNFTADYYFFDDGGDLNNNSYDYPEAIFVDSNENNQVDPGLLDGSGDKVVAVGTADLKEDEGLGVNLLAYHDTMANGVWDHGDDIFVNLDGDMFYTTDPDRLINYQGSNLRPSLGELAPMEAGDTLTGFDTLDNVYWYDYDDPANVSATDAIWIDQGDDGIYNANGQSVSALGPATQLLAVFDGQFSISFNGGAVVTITLENSGEIRAKSISRVGLETTSASPIGAPVCTDGYYFIITDRRDFGEGSWVDLIGAYDLPGDTLKGGTLYEETFSSSWQVGGNTVVAAYSWYIDANHNNMYDNGEAVLEQIHGSDDLLLEPLDQVMISGRADLTPFTTQYYFFDAGGGYDNDEFDAGESIFSDTDGDGYIDTGVLYLAPDVVHNEGLADVNEDRAWTPGGLVHHDLSPFGAWAPGEDIFINYDGDSFFTPAADTLINYEGSNLRATPGSYHALAAGADLAPFDPNDDLYWHDQGSVNVVDSGDALWQDSGDDAYYNANGQSVSGVSPATSLAEKIDWQFDIAFDGGAPMTVTLENSGQLYTEEISVTGLEAVAPAGFDVGDVIELGDTGEYYIVVSVSSNLGERSGLAMIGETGISGQSVKGKTWDQQGIPSDLGSSRNRVKEDTQFDANGLMTLPLKYTDNDMRSFDPGDVIAISDTDTYDPDTVFAIMADYGTYDDTEIRLVGEPNRMVCYDWKIFEIYPWDSGPSADIDDFFLNNPDEIAAAITDEIMAYGEATYNSPGFTGRYKIDSDDTTADSFVQVTNTTGLGQNVADLLKLGVENGGSEVGPDRYYCGSPSDDATTGFEVYSDGTIGLVYADSDPDGLNTGSFDDGEDIYQESVASGLTYSDGADLVVYVGGDDLQVGGGDDAWVFSDEDNLMYIDASHDGDYDAGEVLLHTGETDIEPGTGLPYIAEVLQRYDGPGQWIIDDQDMHNFPISWYFTDGDGNNQYTDGEAIVDQSGGSDLGLLENTDDVVLTGDADIKEYPAVIINPDGTLWLNINDGSGGPVDTSGVSKGDLLLIDENGNPNEGTAIWVVAAEDGYPFATSMLVLGVPGAEIPDTMALWQGTVEATGAVSDIDDFFLDSGEDIAAAITDEIISDGEAYFSPFGFSGLYKIDSDDTTILSAVNVTSPPGGGTNAAALLNLGPEFGGVEAGPDKVLCGAPLDDEHWGLEVISGPDMPLAYNDADPDGDMQDSAYQDGQDIYQESNGGGLSFSDGEDYLVYNGTDETQVGPGAVATGFVDTDDIMYRDATHDDYYTVGEVLLYTNSWDIDEGGYLRQDTQVLQRADGPGVWWIPQQDMHNFPASYQYIDANCNGVFDPDEAIVNQGSGIYDELLDSGDTIVRPGLANLVKMGVVNVRPGVWKFLVPGWFEPLEILIVVAIIDDTSTGFYTWTGCIKPVNV